MKSYNDLFSNAGVVTALKSVDTTKFNEVFGESYDTELLDDFILFSNGNYICTKETENLFANDSENALSKIAKMIWLKFYQGWKATLKTLAVDYDVAYSETETTDRNKDTTNNIDETKTDTNKVFAYNSETASDSALNDITSNTDGKGNEKENVTKIKSGYNYGLSLMDILAKYRNEQVENTFCDIVKNDIIGFLCYNIY